MSRVATAPIPADAGIFGLIDRRVARQIIALAENDRYFPGLRGWVGFRQAGVVVERNARYDDRPRVSLAGLFRLAKTAMFSFSTLPLAIFHVIGATATVVFLGAERLLAVLQALYQPGHSRLDFLCADRQFLRALNALGISILGEYVIRIYDQVRGRPLYLVDRTVNMETGTGAVAADEHGGRPPLCGVDGAGRGALAARRRRRFGRQRRRLRRCKRKREIRPAGALADRSRRVSRTCATGCAIASVHVVHWLCQCFVNLVKVPQRRSMSHFSLQAQHDGASSNPKALAKPVAHHLSPFPAVPPTDSRKIVPSCMIPLCRLGMWWSWAGDRRG